MKEYSLRIPINAWNAIRYAIITLALVPLAEKLWAFTHSKRTGARLVRGHKARLRRSKLAYWGLHQEVDEESWQSKVAAIAVCVMHIAGALLLEYGSGSRGTYVLQDAVLSSTLRDDGAVLADEVYYIDAGYVFGKPLGSTDCIDGGPRDLSDFGLRVRQKPAFIYVPSRSIPKPSFKADLKAEYSVHNSGWRFQMYDNGSARWYAFHKRSGWNAAPKRVRVLGFVNETVACHSHNASTVACSKYKEDEDHLNLLSKVLAQAAVKGVFNTQFFWSQKDQEISTIMSRVSVHPIGRRQSEADAQTAWVRDGMPRKKIPGKTRMDLKLNIQGLKDGCNHRYAVHVSNGDNLKKFKVFNSSFLYTKQVWIRDQEDHGLLLWIVGNFTALGTVTQLRNGFCSSIKHFRLCITRVELEKHEVAFYVEKKHNGSDWYVQTKVFNFYVEGIVRNADALNLAIQANIEAWRKNQIRSHLLHKDIQERVTELIESGRVYSGLVRVAGSRMQGKSVLRWSDIATINVLGIVGVAILTFLVAIPIPMLLFYREGKVSDVESLFRRAVMGTYRVQIWREVPDRAPTIVANGVG